MASIESLQARIKELEAELTAAKAGGDRAGREKIAEMSSEVVDSNPYRFVRSSKLERTSITETSKSPQKTKTQTKRR